MRRLWLLAFLVLLSGCGHTHVDPGTRLVAGRVDLSELAVVFPWPEAKDGSAGTYGTSDWLKLRSELDKTVVAMLARHAVTAKVHMLQPGERATDATQRYMLVVQLSSAIYMPRSGTSEFLRLELWDRSQQQRLWFASAILSPGLTGLTGKWPELAGDLTASMEFRLTQDALLPPVGTATTAQAAMTAEPAPAASSAPVLWSPAAKAAYEVYRLKIIPKAFVLDSTGIYASQWGHQWDNRPPSAYALQRCVELGGVNCRVVDIDDHPISPP